MRGKVRHTRDTTRCVSEKSIKMLNNSPGLLSVPQGQRVNTVFRGHDRGDNWQTLAHEARDTVHPVSRAAVSQGKSQRAVNVTCTFILVNYEWRNSIKGIASWAGPACTARGNRRGRRVSSNTNVDNSGPTCMLHRRP